jgi:methyl-accepting chemotaxis protein
LTVSRKLLGSVIAILLAAFGGLGWFVNARAREALVSQALAALEAVRDARGRLIEHDFQLTDGTVRLITDTIVARDALQGYAAARAAGRPFDTVKTGFAERVSEFSAVFGWADVLVVLNDGTVAFSTDRLIPVATRLHDGSWRGSVVEDVIIRASSGPVTDVHSSDYSQYHPSGDPSSFFSSAVADADGQRLGACVIRVSASSINAVVADETGLGKTGETYLVGPDLRMRSNSRFASASTILTQETRTDAPRRALAGESGTAMYIDYRGAPVVAAFRPLQIPGIHWGIVAKMDVAEVLAPARALTLRIVVLFSAATVGAAVLLVILLRRVVLAPIDALSAGAKRVGAGDYARTVTVNANDELGQLAATMNSMMHAVGDNVASLAEARAIIQQRYEELSKLQALRDNLTHMIVHDLRSPLTSVLGYLDLLKMELPEGENAGLVD